MDRAKEMIFTASACCLGPLGIVIHEPVTAKKSVRPLRPAEKQNNLFLVFCGSFITAPYGRVHGVVVKIIPGAARLYPLRVLNYLIAVFFIGVVHTIKIPPIFNLLSSIVNKKAPSPSTLFGISAFDRPLGADFSDDLRHVLSSCHRRL